VRRATVVNFSAPELNQLALHLAQEGRLDRFVRPYLNKGRRWERLLGGVPGLGGAYARTFGRRTLPSRALVRRAEEAGVIPDIAGALVGRLSWLPATWRGAALHVLQERQRRAVRDAGPPSARNASDVVAYPGCGGPAFAAAHRWGARAFLSYPIAHHRHHLKVRVEEVERAPSFASTWLPPPFTPDYLAELDAEIESSDRIVLGSRYAARTFVSEGVAAERLHVIPYGFDPSVFDAAPNVGEERPFKVVFAGQLSQRKGLSYLLDGYRRFRREDSRLLLIGAMVGDPAPLLPYRGIFDHIPHLTRPALADTLRGCHAFVFPTLLEGMPLVICEAMACGLPIIATANGPDELVRDGVDGFLVPERDPEAIAERLELLYRDSTLRQQMAFNARERALQFSWRRFCERFVELLDSEL